VKVEGPGGSGEKLGQRALARLGRCVPYVLAAQLEKIDGEQHGRCLGLGAFANPPCSPGKGRSAARRAAHKIMSQRKSPTPRGAQELRGTNHGAVTRAICVSLVRPFYDRLRAARWRAVTRQIGERRLACRPPAGSPAAPLLITSKT